MWSASGPGRLYPREMPGTHCTGGWVGPGTGLDRCGKLRPTGTFFISFRLVVYRCFMVFKSISGYTWFWLTTIVHCRFLLCYNLSLFVIFTGEGGGSVAAGFVFVNSLFSSCLGVRLLHILGGGGVRAHLGTCLPLNVWFVGGIPSTGRDVGNPYNR